MEDKSSKGYGQLENVITRNLLNPGLYFIRCAYCVEMNTGLINIFPLFVVNFEITYYLI